MARFGDIVGSNLTNRGKNGSKKSLVIYPDYAHEGLPGLSDTIFEFMSRL